MAQVIEQIKLYFTEGTSDKVYETWITQKAENSYTVDFQNGRRGSTLKPGTKTVNPVDLAKAREIYERLVKSKLKDGYTPCESGQVYAGSEKAGLVSGLTPMLLNPLTASQADVLNSDDAWALEEKFDGERQMAELNFEGGANPTFCMSNRKGLICVHTPALEAAVRALASYAGIRSGRLVLDGERMGDQYRVFDLLALGVDLMPQPLSERQSLLEKISEAFNEGDCAGVLLKSIVYRGQEKKAALDKFRAANAEGVVYKRLDSVYSAGRPASGGNWLKLKFVESASCVVSQVNEGKRSVGLLLKDANGKSVDVGNVTIPANHNVPTPGSIVEVQYLYAYPQGSLFQPVYQGVRGDLEESDCTVAQLKYKAAA